MYVLGHVLASGRGSLNSDASKCDLVLEVAMYYLLEEGQAAVRHNSWLPFCLNVILVIYVQDKIFVSLI